MPKANASKYQAAQDMIERGIWRADPDVGVVYGQRGQAMGCLNNCGYVRLKLRDPSKRNGTLSVLAHRVIWEAIHGPIPTHLTVNHIDGDKINNSLSNLEVVTMAENIQHSYDIGLNPKIYGEQHHATTLTALEVQDIYQRAWAGPRGVGARLAEEYRTTRRMVSAIKHRRRRHEDIDALLTRLVGP
jgi:hypothetical protein